jgi:hypothetical protein
LKPKLAKRLTTKEESFVNAYSAMGNASAAYRYAYPASQRWTPHAVAVEASRLKNKKKIRLALLIARYGRQQVLIWAKEELQRREARRAKGLQARKAYRAEAKAALLKKMSERFFYWEQ